MAVGSGVGVGDGVAVGAGVGDGVGVSVGTGVAVGSGVGVAVGSGVAVAVGTGVGVDVGAGVGGGPTRNCVCPATVRSSLSLVQDSAGEDVLPLRGGDGHHVGEAVVAKQVEANDLPLLPRSGCPAARR